MSTMYLPKLFIREIGNATSSQIYRVIEDLGFGKVTRINFRGKNAVAYVDWDIPNTRATRILLQEGARPLSLYYSDDRFWKVSAYKSYEEREQEHERKRIAKQEEEFLKKEREQEKFIQELALSIEQEMNEQAQRQTEALVEAQAQVEEKFIQELALSLEQDIQSQAETHGWDPDDSWAEKVPIIPLDYGNVAEFYPNIRDTIRKRIRHA